MQLAATRTQRIASHPSARCDSDTGCFQCLRKCDGVTRARAEHNGKNMSVHFDMRGPRNQKSKSPSLLLLLLLLLSGLKHTVVCEEEDADPEAEGTENRDPDENDANTPTTYTTPTEDGVNEEERGSGGSGEHEAGSTIKPTDETGVTSSSLEEEDFDLLLIIIPVVLVILIISIIFCGLFIHRRLNSGSRPSEVDKEDPFLDGSSTEKVPMPMFEEDVPSVLELEMEDLDDWIKKDGDQNQLA
uniref:Transmembrane protein 154 n=1 Tax=Knipowitschia caucasica TaxID=637954 RepID=A0AAV2LF89_KNICA